MGTDPAIWLYRFNRNFYVLCKPEPGEEIPAELACPVCSLTPEEDMGTHLQGHTPAERCPNCGEKHTGWKVDWDGVMYPRPDVSLFYCDPCGVYTPVNVGEEVSPSGEE
jgi:hypothetical protein